MEHNSYDCKEALKNVSINITQTDKNLASKEGIDEKEEFYSFY